MCEFMKRDTKLCGAKIPCNLSAAPSVGPPLCWRHKGAVPYLMCAANCGKVVSSRHGRSKCSKCDPNGAKFQSLQGFAGRKMGERRPGELSPAERAFAAERVALAAAVIMAENALTAAKLALTCHDIVGPKNVETPLMFTDDDVDGLLAELDSS